MPNIIIEKTSPVKPATLLTEPQIEEDNHNCIEIVQMKEEQRTAAQSKISFVYRQVVNNQRVAGQVVTAHEQAHEVLASGALSKNISTQQAELKALIEACNLANGLTVNFYTDSR